MVWNHHREKVDIGISGVAGRVHSMHHSLHAGIHFAREPLRLARNFRVRLMRYRVIGARAGPLRYEYGC